MKVRAVVPPFIPMEMARPRLLAVLPDLQIVNDPLDTEAGDPSEVELLALTPFTPLEPETIRRMAKLRFIQVAAAGYNNVPLAECKARGIRVANVPGANAQSVAEHVIMVVLALLRDVISIDRGMREGDWPPLTGGRDLYGKVFGIVGMGRIGRELAKRLIPFEVSVIYFDAIRLPESEERTLGATFVELPELLAAADIVSLHLPVTATTRGILGSAQLSTMKDDAILVNSARAEIVDMDALRAEMQKGRLRVALDVYPKEPPDFADPMFKFPSSIFTPHNAGVTVEAQERILTEAIRNLLRVASGKDPLYEVRS
jgi:phosphoglycerate dehydrogenase-like enzyme